MTQPRLRPSQEQILAYQRGRMGISAVPGSGKTWTLARLAAELINRGRLEEDQEVLVVTLVNSAVDNFNQRIAQFTRRRLLLPGQGYRVRTLHGLAHDIVRQRPELAGLDEKFQIIDDRDADAVRSSVARAWLEGHPHALDGYLSQTLQPYQLSDIHTRKLPDLVARIALSFIRSMKNLALSPEQVRQKLDSSPQSLPLAELGWQLYADYQRSLAYRGAVDFDDLIRLALQVLQTDPEYLARLRHAWPFILEDEAQDSNELQEQILSLLSGPDGNWVRVGDPNQAIYETFTTANPRYLRDFLESPGVVKRHLPESGRSTLSIIALANHLVEYTMYSHPNRQVRDALKAPPEILPTPGGDPQPNPPDDPAQVYLRLEKRTSDEELEVVASSAAGWLKRNPEGIVAALATTNRHGYRLAQELERRGVPYVDSLLQSSSATRQAAGVLERLLTCLSHPDSPAALAGAFRAWRAGDEEDPEARKQLDRTANLLSRLARVEEYLWPVPENDWLERSGLERSDPQAFARLSEFRTLVQRWQAAVVLPVDQLLLTLAQDVLDNPVDLALAHKLAAALRQAGQSRPGLRLPDYVTELHHIASHQRRFLGFSEDDSGFDPQQHAGKVVLATMHKSKGLEWDRVYLLSVNEYDFPSGLGEMSLVSEPWFCRDSLNLEAEALAQFDAARDPQYYHSYQEKQATLEARQDYARERLRLLYVGITRARKELVITWNTGKNGNLKPALALGELDEFWHGRQHGAGL
jgi:DNA helicase-2/ATP-dependent DNA helicase PcrA